MAISFLTGESVDGNIALPDNKKIILGTGSDLEIYHDGSNSYIKDSGAGNLIVNATNFVVNNSGDTQNMIIAVDGGATTLFCAGVGRLATTSTGVSVTGNIDLPSNGAILFDNTSNIEQYYIRNGGSSQSRLQIGKGNPGSYIKLSLHDAGKASMASTDNFSNGYNN